MSTSDAIVDSFNYLRNYKIALYQSDRATQILTLKRLIHSNLLTLDSQNNYQNYNIYKLPKKTIKRLNSEIARSKMQLALLGECYDWT